MAMGDLDRRISVRSNDEIKDLVDALNRMTANLRDTAKVAGTIAQGDLSVEAKPLSDKDTLGIAMQRMIGNLRATAKLADAIAQGDLTVDAKPLSDKDTLGLALESMLAKLRGRGERCACAPPDNVSSGSQELSASAEQLSQGATEQASAAEEASASMEQMAANIKQNADNASQTEKIARQSATDAEAGGEAVARAVQRHADHRREDHHRAGDRPPDRPAGAERRGGSGAGRRARPWLRGGRLRGAQAGRAQPDRGAGDQRAFGDTVSAAQQAGEMLTKLVPDIKKTAELVEEISAACREQDIGAEQINQAIQQLDKVTQQNASASEQMSATSEELAAQAEQLQDTIAFFRIGDGRRQAAGAPAAAKFRAGHIGGARPRSAPSRLRRPSSRSIRSAIRAPLPLLLLLPATVSQSILAAMMNTKESSRSTEPEKLCKSGGESRRERPVSE